MYTILGLLFLWLAIVHIIIAFFINTSIADEYYGEEDKWV